MRMRRRWQAVVILHVYTVNSAQHHTIGQSSLRSRQHLAAVAASSLKWVLSTHHLCTLAEGSVGVCITYTFTSACNYAQRTRRRHSTCDDIVTCNGIMV